MESLPKTDVSLVLESIRNGDAEAMERLLPIVYADLRSLAEKIFRSQDPSHTLQPTALVHEAYMRLVKPEDASFRDRRHFLNVAAMAMRQLLTDYARARRTDKRGGQHERVELEPEAQSGDGTEVDLEALDAALTELQELDERQARIVELRFLTGLSVAETADVLGVSERTVYLDSNMARAWLEDRLNDR